MALSRGNKLKKLNPDNEEWIEEWEEEEWE